MSRENPTLSQEPVESKIVLGKNAQRTKQLRNAPILKPPPVEPKFQKSPDGATGELV